MLLRTIYERNQMNLVVNFKGNSAKCHACASSNICRMPHMVTVWSVEPTTIIHRKMYDPQCRKCKTVVSIYRGANILHILGPWSTRSNSKRWQETVAPG
jgi:hypothetical protein